LIVGSSDPLHHDRSIFLIDAPPERRSYQMALYALHLSSGHSLKCKTLRVATNKKYLFDAATLITSCGDRDPRYLEPNSKTFAPAIQVIYEEMARWEKVSENVREPYTPAMQAHLEFLCTTDTNPDSLLHVLRDFFLMGLYGGFRQSEWSQDTNSNPSSPDRNHMGTTQAFTIADFSFLGAGDVRLSLDKALNVPPTHLSSVDTCWRTQKNKQHGEKKRFSANIISHNCYVAAAQRTCQRFLRLRGANDTNTPLSIYVTSFGTQRLVNAKDISRCMQYLAGAVYHIHDPKELSRFSAHSLRVGACVILHAQGLTESQIQFILRWRSLAFMAYLRNLTALSDRQNMAFNTFAMPREYVSQEATTSLQHPLLIPVVIRS
jgi:hypothetical protein